MSQRSVRRTIVSVTALLALAACSSGGSAGSTSATTTGPTSSTRQPRPTTALPSTSTSSSRPGTTSTTPPATTGPGPRPGANGLTIRQVATGAWVVDVDPQHLRVSLMPGRLEPVGTFIHPPTITPDLAPTVVAAFNGGFQFKDAQGGLFLGGVEAAPLVAGAASLVIRTDGTATIGAWQRDVRMAPDVEGVLQNLQLMVDAGRPTDVSDADVHRWGSTFPKESTPTVPRSGVCESGDGRLHWVGRLAIGAATLATSMVQAGCMRGMELDINPRWVSFSIFDHPDPVHPATLQGRNLFDGMRASPDLYRTGPNRNWLMLSWR
ncbi:MAG: hypothetical protein JWN46_3480 [Acidimicrobiales bacterium]|nr:hypothetical protein [Acidimicrobiales bacterium]